MNVPSRCHYMRQEHNPSVSLHTLSRYSKVGSSAVRSSSTPNNLTHQAWIAIWRKFFKAFDRKMKKFQGSMG